MSNFRKKVYRVLVSFASVYGGIWTVLEFSEYLGFDILKGKGVIGLTIIILVCTNIFFFWRSYSRVPNSPPSESLYSGKELAKTLVDQFKKMSSIRDYQTILRIGMPLSRSLWLEGLYEARVAIGSIVVKAAQFLNEPEAQAHALIDDVGWTSVALKEYKRAEDSLQRGIEIAKKHQLVYLEAKGYRHLAGLAIQRKQISKVLLWLKEADCVSAGIRDTKQRDEMVAGIRYGEAEAFLLSDELDKAEKASLESQNLFLQRKDMPRIVKSYAQIGKIRERQGKIMEASEYYQQGLKLAEEIDRRDEIIRNNLGLARIAQSQGNVIEAQQYLQAAKEMRKITPLVFEIDSLEIEIENIERKQDNGNGND